MWGVEVRMTPYGEQPQRLQTITFATLADHFHTRGLPMKIADFPTVKLSSFLAALKLDIDNYAILVKSALCALIRTRPRCQYKPTVYFCEFSDKFQPPWLCYLNILHTLIWQLLDRRKQAEAWTRACNLWRHTIGSIVTIEFFHHGNLNLCPECQAWHYWRNPTFPWPAFDCISSCHSIDSDAFNTRLYLYRKYVVASACEGDRRVNLIFPQMAGGTMNDMLFTDPIFNGRRIAAAQVTLTQRLFNIRIGVHDRGLHLYYPLKENWQVLRFEKFYSKRTDQGEKNPYYYCGGYDVYVVYKPYASDTPRVCQPISLDPNVVMMLAPFAHEHVYRYRPK